MRRRSVLSLLGLGGASVLTAKGRSGACGKRATAALPRPPFQPVRVPLPVDSDGLNALEQQAATG